MGKITESNPYVIRKVKASDTMLTNDATANEESDLTVSIPANTVWLFQYSLTFELGDLCGFDWSIDPNSGTITDPLWIVLPISLDAETPGTYAPLLYAGDAGHINVSFFTDAIGRMDHRCVITAGAAARSVKFMWSQDVPQGTATIVYAGATVIAQRIS